MPLCAGASDNAGRTTWQKVAQAEAFFTANSFFASKAPQAYGGTGLLLSPFAIRGKDLVCDTAVVAMAAGLFGYNLMVPENADLSEEEVFVHNMIGWHLFAWGARSVYRWRQPDAQGRGLRLGVAHSPRGPMALLALPF